MSWDMAFLICHEGVLFPPPLVGGGRGRGFTLTLPSPIKGEGTYVTAV